jgi:Baseplate J-like protein
MANPPTITVSLTVDSLTGAQPTPPATINQNLLQLVTAIDPGYTILPAGLIEDLSSTATYAIALMDAAAVEFLNSITPILANPWQLIQQGNLVGVPQGQASNTSVLVVFTGTPGFVVAPGVVVSDGTNQYTVQDGGAVQTGGKTAALFCLANAAGSFAVPINSVTTIVTSIPGTGITSCTNPNTGVPGAPPQLESDYRGQVLTAWRASAQGMGTYLKTLLNNVPGVQSRLISVQQASSGWKVIVGGGDPYAIAYAIFSGLFDITNLVGSTTTARNQTINLSEPPDTYTVVFIEPPQENVIIQLTWNTIAPNFVASAAVAALGGPAILAYINAIPVGQPINQYAMEQAFTDAIISLLTPDLISKMVWTVSVNGVAVTPVNFLYSGDPESFFFIVLPNIVITQG